jgi:hypothetical protein
MTKIDPDLDPLVRGLDPRIPGSGSTPKSHGSRQHCCSQDRAHELVAVVAELRPQIQELRVIHEGSPYPEYAFHCTSFAQAISRFTDLSSLTANSWLLNSQGLVLIADKCRHLRKLNFFSSSLSADSIAYVIGRGEGRLCELAFDAYDFVDQDYTILERLSSSLEQLEIQWAKNLGPLGLQTIWRLSYLRKLMIDFVPGCGEEFFLSAQDQLQQLVCLSLGDGVFSDLELLELARKCPRLEELKLRECASLTDPGLVSVFKCWKSLHTLQLADMEDLCGTFLVELRKQLPALQVLGIIRCKRIEPAILAVFKFHNPDIQVQITLVN